MKKVLATLMLTSIAVSAQAAATNTEQLIAGILLGTIISQQRVVIPQPQPVVIPQQIYTPHPVYTQPQYYPVPRVITSSEPCTYYGQMVMTFDQYGRPVGYRNCQ